MKNLFNNFAIESPSLNGTKYFRTNENGTISAKFREEGLLKPQAVYQMATGQIPDLWDVCNALENTFTNTDAPYSAAQFIQIMQDLDSFEPEQTKKFVKNPKTRHVLIATKLFEVVLIHWKPGKASDIHGHEDGGCLFKLLQGKLEELRYSPEQSPKLLTTNSYRSGNLVYIDDSIAYHQVGNPYGSSAISLHVYLKGQ